ncbi:hypothetical protein [Nitrospira sp. Nam74]
MDLSTDWDNLFVNNPSPMWAFHVNTLRFVDVNQATVVWSGYTRTEFLHLKLDDIHPAENVAQLSKVFSANADPLDVLPVRFGIMPFRKKNGSFAFMRMMCQPVREHIVYVQGKEESLSGSPSDKQASGTPTG